MQRFKRFERPDQFELQPFKKFKWGRSMLRPVGAEDGSIAY
jgi:hypothetical protein